MVVTEELGAALSTLKELVHDNPDEAFKRAKTDLGFGLVAFMPQETLQSSGNVQLYVKKIAAAQREILKDSIAKARLNYNEGFILACLVSLSFYRKWNNETELEGTLQESSMRLEELMQSTDNEFIRLSCQKALGDMTKMIVAEEIAAALSTLKELVPVNPDEAFKRVKTDLGFGLVAFKPQEKLKISDNVQLYVKRLEAAQREILKDSIAKARLNYNEGFILACLVSRYRQWSSDADLEGELKEFSIRLEELMQSTDNEFIRLSCRNALRDIKELESYIYEQSEFFYTYLVRYYTSDFDPEYISNLLLRRELPEIKVLGFLLAIYRNNRYLRSNLRELVDADQISFVLSKVLEGIGKFSERAIRKDLRKLAAGFFRAELAKHN